MMHACQLIVPLFTQGVGSSESAPSYMHHIYLTMQKMTFLAGNAIQYLKLDW